MNPFSIGVAAGEAGVSIGDGIVLRVILWVVLTGMSVAWVLRYAARVRRDPAASLVGWDDPMTRGVRHRPHDAEDLEHAPAPSDRLTGTQKWVLVITAFAFGLMIFSVIPWSSMLGGSTAPADYYYTHEVAGAQPFWFELNWWFPQLAMLFILASVAGGHRREAWARRRPCG